MKASKNVVFSSFSSVDTMSSSKCASKSSIFKIYSFQNVPFSIRDIFHPSQNVPASYERCLRYQAYGRKFATFLDFQGALINRSINQPVNQHEIFFFSCYGDETKKRNKLIMPSINSTNIFIFDTSDERAPTLHKVTFDPEP